MTSIEDALKGIRKDLQGFYYYYCDILIEEYDDDADTSIYKKYREQLPCNLDWLTSFESSIMPQGAIDLIHKKGKLYTNELIPTGSIIHVYKLDGGIKGEIQTFKNSSPSQYYLSHYETVVELYDGFV